MTQNLTLSTSQRASLKGPESKIRGSKTADSKTAGSKTTASRRRLKARDIDAPIPADWRGELGATLDDDCVRVRLVGPGDAPVVAVLGGISAGRFVADANPDSSGKSGGASGWWETLVRPGGGVDLKRYRVLGLDFSPRQTQAPLALTPADQAQLLTLALDAAGIETLHAFVGASYGGMVALAFARLFPARVQRLVVLCAAHRPHPIATAWRGVQRRILEFAIECGRPEEGAALARELAMTTYRTPDEFDARFTPGLNGATSEACDYLIARGRAHASSMSAARYLSLSAAIDRHHEDPACITAPALLIGYYSDQLVPVADMRALHERLGGPSRLLTFPSLYGHDAFLKETDALTAPIADFLNEDTSDV